MLPNVNNCNMMQVKKLELQWYVNSLSNKKVFKNTIQAFKNTIQLLVSFSWIDFQRYYSLIGHSLQKSVEF